MLGTHSKLFSRWLFHPLSVGAVVPSGKALARAMADQAASADGKLILELGGGTGVVTEALLARGVDPRLLIVVERDRQLHGYLRGRFREVRVVCGRAENLGEILDGHGVGAIGAVVSSLPFLSMAPSARRGVVAESFRYLGDGGFFLQFTYGPRSPLSPRVLKGMGIEGVPTARIRRNIPPATVWRYARARSAPTGSGDPTAAN